MKKTLLCLSLLFYGAVEGLAQCKPDQLQDVLAAGYNFDIRLKPQSTTGEGPYQMACVFFVNEDEPGRPKVIISASQPGDESQLQATLQMMAQNLKEKQDPVDVDGHKGLIMDLGTTKKQLFFVANNRLVLVEANYKAKDALATSHQELTQLGKRVSEWIKQLEP